MVIRRFAGFTPTASKYDASECPLARRGKRSALVQPHENCLGKKMLARLVLHLATSGSLADLQMPGGECKKVEAIMMRAVASWRIRPAIAGLPEVIERLLKSLPARLRSRTERQRLAFHRNVVGRPVMPRSYWSVRVLAKEDKTAGLGRRIIPIERRRQILALAGELPRYCSAVMKGA